MPEMQKEARDWALGQIALDVGVERIGQGYRYEPEPRP
jgi:hypothetical protein